MSVYALNNYSASASGHELKVISGRGSVNCLSIVCESGGDYKFTHGYKKNICELKLLSSKNPGNYSSIARESTKSYSVPNLPDRGLAPDSTGHLSELSDSALVARLESLRGKERKTQLNILLYIIEVEKRKLYLPRGYNSLFEFCTRHLGYSRSSAYRRIQAARCIGIFPKVADMLLTGELNLSVVSLISGILTKENINNILSRVVGKSYRDAEIAIAMYKPIETITRDKVKPVCVMEKKSASDFGTDPGTQNSGKSLNVETNRRNCNNNNTNKTDLCLDIGTDPAKETESGKKTEKVELKQKFKLEFMVDPEFMKKLERIKSRLSRKYPEGVNFEKLFNIVMDEYLDRHSPDNKIKRRKKREAKKQNRKTASQDKENTESQPFNNKQQNKLQHSTKETSNMNNKQKKVNTSKSKQPPAGKGVSSKQKKGQENRREIAKEAKNANNKICKNNKQRTRNIPAAVRDEVFARDSGRCTFVSENGKRCNSTWNLEIDHIVPFAKGGDNSPENLRLLCAKHNLMEAKHAYGKDFMKKYIKKE